MNTWETLVASALVGIDRQSPLIDFTDPALHDYQASLQSQSATQQILGAAGLIAAYQTVGQGVAKASLPLPAAANSAQLACCSPQTTQHLSTILQENRYAQILPELLQLLAQAQQTVPPDFLPLLLDVGKRDKKLRPLILPILGDLGQWLVRQNHQWEYGLGAKIADVDLANLQEIWATGSRSERSAALAQWRELQPADSREALAASWKQEKADDRAAWLEILQTGLSLADEEFLEVALVDRSEPVRRQAAHLLNQLPSQYRQRLTKLAIELLIIKDANGYQIKINLPQADSLAWIAAGVLDKPSSKAVAPAKVTIEQLSPVLIGADLGAWPQDIDRLVTSIQNITAGNIILSALARAACYQRRMDWIEVLITRSPTIFSNFDAQTLLSSLPSDDRSIKERFFTQLLTADNSIEALPNNLAVMRSEQYWSKTLSSLIFQKFHQYAQQQSYQYYVQQLSSNISSHLDISILPEVQKLQAGLAPDKFNYSTCIECLEFRRDIQAVFDTA
jgi:Family of unknown function (DUF5691)